MREVTNEKERSILEGCGVDPSTATWREPTIWTVGDLLDILPDSVFLTDDEGWENDCGLRITCDGNGEERRWHVRYVHYDYEEGAIVDLEFWRRELVHALVETVEWMAMNEKLDCIK